MKIIAAMLLLFAASGTVPAQEKSNQLSPTVRLYQPKNLNGYRAIQVAQFVNSVLGTPGSTPSRQSEVKPLEPVKVNWEDVASAIVIRGGTPADQDAAEALLRRFDVPETNTPTMKALASSAPSSFEITAYLIRADEGAAGGTSEKLMPVPKELQSAVDEMKQTFSYKAYSLWDAVITQPGGGPVELSGILPSKPSATPATYSLAFQRSHASGNETITLEGFEFVLKQPWLGEPLQSRIAHSVTLRVGQKLVLGKIRLIPSENADLFLILTAKLK